MTFWILAGLIAAGTVAVLARTLLARRAAPPDSRAFDLAVYRDQLAEIERDLERGVLSEAEAASARLEIERRILASGRPAADEMPEPPRAEGRWLAAFLAVVLPLAGLAIYLELGSPGHEGLPFAERPQLAPGDAGERASVLAQVDQRLARHPDDDQAWLMKAHLLRQDGAYTAAADAYRQAGRLAPERLEPVIGLAETLVAQAEGEVTPEARGHFARALQIDAANPSARYYAGLAMVQDGMAQEAYKVWSDLLADSPPDAAWTPVVERQLARLAHMMGMAAPPDETAPGETAPSAATPSGPSAADVAAASEMSAEERSAMIRSMVDRLAARLEEEPDDLEGWLRLARSYQVLGETDEARAALARAEALAAELPADSPLRGAVKEALRNLPSSD